MTRDETDMVALTITARWPHPAMTDFDLDVMAADLEAVPAEAVARAISRLVSNGETYQPRSPAIMRTINELAAEDRAMQRSLAAETRQHQRALEAGQSVPPPPEVLASLRRLGVRSHR